MAKALKQDGTSLRPAPVPAAVLLDQDWRDTDQDPDKEDCDQLPTGSGSQFGLAAVLPLIATLGASGYLGTREDIQQELDGMAMAVRAFALKQPDQVLKEVAAYSARLTEMVVLLHRVEDRDRQYTRVRTSQVQKWLDELDRQFRIASRLIEVQRQDLALLNGQP